MNTSKGPAPGFLRYPEHHMELQRSGERWQVRHGDWLLADSRKTIVVEESRHGEVVYFPPEDVRSDWLSPSDSQSTCPFKGEADYFQVQNESDDIAWRYRQTYDEASEIAGYIAFYADRVQLSTENTQRN